MPNIAKILTIEYAEYQELAALSDTDQKLVLYAQEATKTAYAPYSKYNVGAAILLENGEIIKGSNQENAAYPSGLCAERTALFTYGCLNSNLKIDAIAISATRDRSLFLPCAPCGACRQVMMEYEVKQNAGMRVIFQQYHGKILIFKSVKDILPFFFEFL